VREAKEKGYTKGVKFIDLVHNCEFTIASDNAYDNFYDDEQLYIAVEENQFKNKSARIYKKGVWAEIVNPKTVLPEKWCVKINKENVDLIQLFIHKNCKNYNGYHDGWVARVGNYFYFPQEENTTGHSRGYVSFGYTEITTEQFKQNEKMEKTFGINRNQFAQIYDIACNKWKGLISEMVEENLGLFKSDCQLPESKVKEMFDASTPEQKEVLKRIFPMYKRQLTLEELKGKGKYFSETNDTYAPLLGIRGGGEYEKFAFGLNKDFNWELKVDSHGVKCLIPTKK